MHLEIPEPCHESWQDMTPQEKGKFCDKCCKVVIDFTTMATEKVIEFLNARKNERVCGRFRTDQIAVPANQKNNFRHRAKIFLAALFFVFGGMLFTGCNSHHHPMGGVESRDFAEMNFNSADTPNLKKNNVQGDTVIPVHTDKKHPKGKVKCVTDTTHTNGQLMGRVGRPK